ncbi:MAG: hypothetical protein F4X02_10170 [Chloroflexi bacterium]|nr:hypothetical protein [Chloroflexota bacterium]
MNAKRLTLAAIALGIVCLALPSRPAQAQEFRGFTCGGLLLHVRAGGHVMYEETNRWYHSTCPGDAKSDDDEETADALARRRTAVTCPDLPPRVAVYGHVRGTQCQMVGAVVISMNPELEARGFVDAVDVWSYVNGGIEVCFRSQGWLAFLDAGYVPRMAMELTPFNRDGMTCGAIDRAGTVVLLRQASASAPPPVDETPATLPTFDAVPPADCMIKLQETLFLRDAPGGAIIGLVWLYSEVPVYEVSGDWFRTEFEGQAGYISRFYHSVLRGGCA